MKIVRRIFIGITLAFLVYTIVCGLWLRYSQTTVTTTDLNHHMTVGIITAVLTVVTIVLLAKK